MTLQKASERFCISIGKLNYYEESGLIRYETILVAAVCRMMLQIGYMRMGS